MHTHDAPSAPKVANPRTPRALVLGPPWAHIHQVPTVPTLPAHAMRVTPTPGTDSPIKDAPGVVIPRTMDVGAAHVPNPCPTPHDISARQLAARDWPR